MSGFVSTNATGMPVLGADDVRHADPFYFGIDDLVQPEPTIELRWTSEPEVRGFQSLWWPGSSGMLGDAGDVGVTQSTWWGFPWTVSGCNGRLGFVGYTRDQFGSPLANCTVRCIRTLTNEIVSTVTSDANGYYIATTPYSDAHILTVHGANVAGASVDTLLPA